MSYIIKTAGQQVSTRVRRDRAIALADDLAAQGGGEYEVSITFEDGESRVVYLTSPRAIAKRERGEHFVPWTRLETPSFSAPDIEGFYPAYTRKRIQATVYRAYDADAELPWLVHDGRTGGRQLVANTKQARELTTAMRLGRML